MIFERLEIRFAVKHKLAEADPANAHRILGNDDALDVVTAYARHHVNSAGFGAPSGNLLALVLAFLSSPAGQQLIQEILKAFGL